MDRKFIISFVVMLVMLWFGGYFVHGVLLYNNYAAYPALMRPQESFHTLWPFMLLARICQAFAFTRIYVKGKEVKPWLPQGIRYGILVALLLTIPVYLIYYVVMPYAITLTIKQIVFDGALIVLMGIVVAWINR